jgi:uncharacterized protein (TIGR03435 family)
MVLGRAVRDETGLKGIYKFDVKWTPESSASIPAAPVDSPLTPGAEGPSIFTAFEEQLGLKLESTRGPVDIVVIRPRRRAFARLGTLASLQLGGEES